MSIHAIAMAVDFNSYPIGWTYIFAWSKIEVQKQRKFLEISEYIWKSSSIHSLGSICYCFCCLYNCSEKESILDFLRISFPCNYRYWYLVVFYWSLGIVFLVLHTPLGVALSVAPGFALYLFDLALIALDILLFKPTKVKVRIF